MTEPQKKPRGFASMSAAKLRQVSSRGGRTAHKKGVAYEWNHIEAAAAGERGRQRRKENYQSLQQERESIKQMLGEE